MTTDHTETPPSPQIQTLHHLAEQTGPMRIRFFLDNDKETGALIMTDPMTFEGNADESAKLFFESVVQQHSTALARAALATAMEERDEMERTLETIATLYESQQDGTTIQIVAVAYDMRCVARAMLAKLQSK